MHACPDITELVYAVLDSELNPIETVRVQTHLQDWAACRDTVASERTFLEVLKSHITAIPPGTKVCN